MRGTQKHRQAVCKKAISLSQEMEEINSYFQSPASFHYQAMWTSNNNSNGNTPRHFMTKNKSQKQNLEKIWK